MRAHRPGFTSIEIVLGILLFGILFVGIVALRTYAWARRETAWTREVYRWIKQHDSQSVSEGDQDTVKPPPPPDDL